MKLHFRAPGYTSTAVNMGLTADENAEIARSLEGGTTPTTSTPVHITRDNIVVVLEAKGKFARLRRIQGEVGSRRMAP